MTSDDGAVQSQAQTYALSFLQERASKSDDPLPPDERGLLRRAQEALRQAEQVIICLGGRAGRLGECIVGTGLLEGLLLALRHVGKAGTPISLLVDESAAELFDERAYQEQHWPQFQVLAAPAGQFQALTETLLQRGDGKHCLVIDLHGAHDGMPFLRVEERALPASSDHLGGHTQMVTTLGRLFRVGVRSYAQRGAERRYADCIEAVFDLPAGAIAGQVAQPRIWLSAGDEARYPLLAKEFHLRRSAILIACFFQSVVPAKCYGRWREVLLLLCQQVARRFPQQTVDFLLACGPDEDLPAGIRQADMLEEFRGFTGVKANARVQVRATPSLRDLAIITRHAALVLSNDTGPGHLAGALQVPTIVPYLPGTVYSKAVWASTLWHRGVTLEPGPFRAQDIEAAVLHDNTDIIDSIPPERLAQQASDLLSRSVLSGNYKTPRSRRSVR